MPLNVWSLSPLQGSFEEFPYGLPRRPVCSDHHLDAGGSQRLKGFGTAVPREHHRGPFPRHRRSRLYSRSLGCTEVLAVFDHFKSHGFRVNDEKTGCSSEAGVHGSVQVSSIDTDRDYHLLILSQ